MQRADGQLVAVVRPHRETTVGRVELEREVARLERHPVLVAQQGDEQLAPEVGSIRIPVDVEPARVVGVLPPFEHVEPQSVVGAAHPHVVGYEVEHVLEPRGRQRRDQPLEARLPPELGVEAVVVDDVVAVGAARMGCQVGRGVKVTDAEPLEVGGEPGGRVEVEPLVELDPVGGARRHVGFPVTWRRSSARPRG